ncbi:asparagine synthase-related protein [Pseudonocardia halophobica]|uniref:asparagine synthase-related protein n=1 Tax=Pseudonocardia halophobica TaxID=29401 RepID=UPI003D8D5D67
MERRVMLDGLRRLLSWVDDPSNAVFAGMREVPPGAVVRVTRDGLREERYRQLRGRSTVAPSGESADEVFGGYRDFHDPDHRLVEYVFGTP